jgi:O-acetyl-ADP-ribose deacetylase (regulator of RNase III)
MPESYAEKRSLFRALVNARPPLPASKSFVSVQDDFLKEETLLKGIVQLDMISPCSANGRISLCQGDITRLKVDAIVNAANAEMLGCFVPGHHCIDNAIHTAAGIQLRHECHAIMREQGRPEKTGAAKITKGYNLPAKYVIHTVGSIVKGKLTKQHCNELADCYCSCLGLAVKSGLDCVAFCCVSTGVFCFPNEKAAEIAVRAVTDFLPNNIGLKRVIFNVFTNTDYHLYHNLLAV